MKKIVAFILICFAGNLPVSAQEKPDITGLWTGELYVDSTKAHLPYEIAVSESKGKLTGYSRIIFFEEGKEEAGYEEISLKWVGDKVMIMDEGFIEHSFSSKPPKRVKKEMNLTLRLTDTEMLLDGKWQTNRTRYYLVATGTTHLKRNRDFKSSALYQKLDSMKLTSKLSFTNPVPATVAKTVPPPQPELPPSTEPDLPMPAAIAPLTNLALLSFNKTKAPAVLKIQAPGKQQKNLYAQLTKPPVYKPVVPDMAIAEKKQPAPVIQPKAGIAPKPVAASSTQQPAPATDQKTAAAITPKPAPVLPPAQPIIAPSITQGAAELDKRVTRADQDFYFESDSLLLTLYDNGEVDGDTVTVIMNGNIVFSKAGLSTRPHTKTVYITPNMDSVKLVMYAESLGEIPPNTGLLIVNDGEKRYDVRFSADLKTNAAIILRRKKNE
ncbi:MAG: hypothetical protein RL172_1509 [Bacteroidota bacterium]|jgi:hypothetical protein